MKIASDNFRSAALPAIITAARAGALDHAWTLFRSAGFDKRLDDPSALAVRGRLQKDSAARAEPPDRAAGFAAAAQSYAAANALTPHPYTMINVATLTALAGDRVAGAAIARDLLAWLDHADAIAETPYFLGATRAEALLLLDQPDAAARALGDAIALDPDGWNDHATTLRQLALISTALGLDHAWLDRYRPPRSLHFAGHLGVAATGSNGLRDRVDAILATANIGFGYGALAAGSDMVIAEALLARGAQLHVVLPTRIDDFIAQSVTPYGDEWRARFDASLNAADSVRQVTTLGGAYEPLANQLCSDVAMGSALLNARQLESSAAQLLVIDDGPGPWGAGIGTARDGDRWTTTGMAQHRIIWPRNAPVTASGNRTGVEGRHDLQRVAMLHIALDAIDTLDDAAFSACVDRVLLPLDTAAVAIDPQPERIIPCGNGRIAVFSTPEGAWAYAKALLALPQASLKLAGHYALVHQLGADGPLVGRAIADLVAIAASALPATPTVSEAFAAALQIAAPVFAEEVGETQGLRLFALRAG